MGVVVATVNGIILNLYKILKQMNLSSKDLKECMDCIKGKPSLSKKQIDSIIDFGIINKEIRCEIHKRKEFLKWT